MTKVISNTSQLLYLYRIGAIKWLPKLFDEIWTPNAVKSELLAGRGKGYDVPNPDDFTWLQVINPYVTGLNNAGMWVSAEVKYRILVLAGESE